MKNTEAVYPRDFRSLLNGHARAEVVNLLNGKVVRELFLHIDGTVTIESGPDKVRVPLDTPITYEPWDLDRGSFLFSCAAFPNGKIATEHDFIDYDNGDRCSIEVP